MGAVVQQVRKADLIYPPRSLQQPNRLLSSPLSPRIQPSPLCAHNFSGMISRRSKVSSMRFFAAHELQEPYFKRHYATSRLSAQGFRISFGKKNMLPYLPLWHWMSMMVAYPKVRLAPTTTPTLTVQPSLPNFFFRQSTRHCTHQSDFVQSRCFVLNGTRSLPSPLLCPWIVVLSGWLDRV